MQGAEISQISTFVLVSRQKFSGISTQKFCVSHFVRVTTAALGPRGPDPGPPAGPTVIKRLSHV